MTHCIDHEVKAVNLGDKIDVVWNFSHETTILPSINEWHEDEVSVYYCQQFYDYKDPCFTTLRIDDVGLGDAFVLDPDYSLISNREMLQSCDLDFEELCHFVRRYLAVKNQTTSKLIFRKELSSSAGGDGCDIEEQSRPKLVKFGLREHLGRKSISIQVGDVVVLTSNKNINSIWLVDDVDRNELLLQQLQPVGVEGEVLWTGDFDRIGSEEFVQRFVSFGHLWVGHVSEERPLMTQFRAAGHVFHLSRCVDNHQVRDLTKEEVEIVACKVAQAGMLRIPPLSSMELFCGVGGLSYGFEVAGIIQSRWAVDSEPAAAAMFRLNHPGAAVFNMSTNDFMNLISSNEGSAPCPVRSSVVLSYILIFARRVWSKSLWLELRVRAFHY